MKILTFFWLFFAFFAFFFHLLWCFYVNDVENAVNFINLVNLLGVCRLAKKLKCDQDSSPKTLKENSRANPSFRELFRCTLNRTSSCTLFPEALSVSCRLHSFFDYLNPFLHWIIKIPNYFTISLYRRVFIPIFIDNSIISLIIDELTTKLMIELLLFIIYYEFDVFLSISWKIHWISDWYWCFW